MTDVPWDGKFEDVLRAHLPVLQPTTPLRADTPLRECGLDSMSTMVIVARLEETYCVSLPPDALVPGTFDTPGTVWAALRAALDAEWARSVHGFLAA